ncbi:phenylacetate--CoA ligase family protein [Nonomuraea diastatica]|uniref:Phenylacetate--CoA ligase family protein n=1 Tax=Nonomuraea diastatica TaxID=1848329 RepID=A0A4R4X3A6_9ACTN|nr:phenylacetate--CoA ligase family protein [Nonomuraea diastatica]TDD24746.1 phenylacetate--CoA ligase family protein [Nonomuraea diastatica]
MTFVSQWRDARKAVKEGRPGIERRQRERLAEAVAHARDNSRFFKELYADLPDQVTDTARLPITDKRQLMARFDDWVADPRVTLEAARAFADDPDLIGAKFLDTYLLTTTSGTTGSVGIFLNDPHTLQVAGALVARGILGTLVTPGSVLKLLARGGRSAKIAGTGGHFAMAAAEMAQRRANKRREKSVRLLSVQSPVPQLTAELNDFQPALIECYASTALLLAREQEAGRLRLNPVMLSLGGEGLTEPEYARISQAFGGVEINNLYGCNEAVALSFTCKENWLHIHEDWVIFEPVDADYQPTPAGELSHTVLLSTLYRREQPILRYDLGDSILRRPDPCPCGSPLMAVRVQGRASSVLTFPNQRGQESTIVPLALATAVERTAGVELFQVVQTAPDALRVRLRTADGADPRRVRESVRTDLANVLVDHDLGNVTIDCGDEPPVQAAGGKYPQVVPYAGNAAS